jgi:uncharacterized membrane protein YdjX (TVP38/TMEM64 family)
MTYNRAGRLLLFLIIAIGTVLALIYREHIDETLLNDWLAQHPWSSPLLFMAFYVVMTMVFFPASLLSLMGGALFGPFWGTIYNQTFAMLGATLNFITARYLSGEWLEKHLSGKIKHIKAGVEAKGWRFVLLIRLVPGIPFSILNYALGLTRIRLLHYITVSFICILPRVIGYSYVGYLGRKSLASEAIDPQLVPALLLLAAVILLPYLSVKIHRYTRKQAVQKEKL